MRVKRPKIAIAAGVLAIVCALLVVLLLSVGLAIMSEEGYGFSAIDIEDLIYTYIWCGIIFAGGVMMLLRRYKIGGAIVLGFSILLIVFALDIWFIGMLGIIGGVLGLVSKEKIPQRILDVAKRYGRVSIREVAAETGKTEADVELAVIELESNGQPIRFDAETREVIYG